MYSRWISTSDLAHFMMDAAVLAFALMKKEGREEGNTGLVGCILKTDRIQGLAQMSVINPLIGRLTDTEAASYRTYAQEKAFRLLSRPDDKTSAQSRDESKGQYAGAIRAQYYIFSVSGLPEPVDEAVSLLTATYAGLMSLEEAQRIAALGGNEYLDRLINA